MADAAPQSAAVATKTTAEKNENLYGTFENPTQGRAAVDLTESITTSEKIDLERGAAQEHEQHVPSATWREFWLSYPQRFIAVFTRKNFWIRNLPVFFGTLTSLFTLEFCQGLMESNAILGLLVYVVVFFGATVVTQVFLILVGFDVKKAWEAEVVGDQGDDTHMKEDTDVVSSDSGEET